MLGRHEFAAFMPIQIRNDEFTRWRHLLDPQSLESSWAESRHVVEVVGSLGAASSASRATPSVPRASRFQLATSGATEVHSKKSAASGTGGGQGCEGSGTGCNAISTLRVGA